MRDGISPVAKNVINNRYKQKPVFDVEKVKRVEAILKDLIDFGFSEHVDEQLLEFDDEGKLKKIIDGKRDESKVIGQGLQSLGDLQNLMNQEEEDDDIDDSMSSSALDDGMSSLYKSKMASEFRG